MMREAGRRFLIFKGHFPQFDDTPRQAGIGSMLLDLLYLSLYDAFDFTERGY